MEAPPTPRRGSGQHGVLPLSRATRRRVLARLLAQADQGDAAAAEALVRLSFHAEQVGQPLPGRARGDSHGP